MVPLPNLIIVGQSGAGKTTLATALGERTGLARVELGHIVRAEAAARGAGSPLLYADQVFRRGDGAHFAARLVARLPLCGALIFVGPRRPEEVNLIQRRVGSAVVVALDAPERVRVARRIEQAEHVGDDRWLERRDDTEAGWGLGELVSHADMLLDGTRPTQELVDLLLHEWRRAR